MDAELSGLRLILVCEGPDDDDVARGLVDREVCRVTGFTAFLSASPRKHGAPSSEESPQDILNRARAHLDQRRTWEEYAPGRPFLRWYDVPDEARKLDIKLHGRGRGLSHAAAAEKALRVVLHPRKALRPEFVVLLRDEDVERGNRAVEMRIARETQDWPCAIAIGCPNPKTESWKLACWSPATKADNTALDKIKREISFDPMAESHRLRDSEGARSAKQVCKKLMAGIDRYELVFLAPGERRRSRGSENGLNDFLDELESVLEDNTLRERLASAVHDHTCLQPASGRTGHGH